MYDQRLGAAVVCVLRIMLEVNHEGLVALVVMVERDRLAFSVVADQNVMLVGVLLDGVLGGVVRLRIGVARQRLGFQGLARRVVNVRDGSLLGIGRVYNSNVLTQVADVIYRVKCVVRNRLAIDRWRKARHFWNCDVARLGRVIFIVWILLGCLVFSWKGLGIRINNQIAKFFINILNIDRLFNVNAVNSNFRCYLMIRMVIIGVFIMGVFNWF